MRSRDRIPLPCFTGSQGWLAHSGLPQTDFFRSVPNAIRRASSWLYLEDVKDGAAGEVCAGQSVQAHARLCGLDGEVAVDLRWDADYELAAEPPARQGSRDRFLVGL
jgi:hypothetical protein